MVLVQLFVLNEVTEENIEQSNSWAIIQLCKLARLARGDSKHFAMLEQRE